MGDRKTLLPLFSLPLCRQKELLLFSLFLFSPPPFFAPVMQVKSEEFPLLFPFSSFLENEKTLGTRLRAREGNVES